MRDVRKVSVHFEYLTNSRVALMKFGSQRTPYCASVNNHVPVGVVSRQWDAVYWACVLCDRRIHKSPPFQRRLQLWENPEVAGSQIWAVRVLTDLGDVMFCTKKVARWAVEWARALSLCSCSARSVIVNATVTQHTRSVNGVSLPTD